MIDTPRTDAQQRANIGAGLPVKLSAMTKLAREMERELAAANASRAQIGPLKARIAELNAVLDRRDRAGMDADGKAGGK